MKSYAMKSCVLLLLLAQFGLIQAIPRHKSPQGDGPPQHVHPSKLDGDFDSLLDKRTALPDLGARATDDDKQGRSELTLKDKQATTRSAPAEMTSGSVDTHTHPHSLSAGGGVDSPSHRHEGNTDKEVALAQAEADFLFDKFNDAQMSKGSADLDSRSKETPTFVNKDSNAQKTNVHELSTDHKAPPAHSAPSEMSGTIDTHDGLDGDLPNGPANGTSATVLDATPTPTPEADWITAAAFAAVTAGNWAELDKLRSECTDNWNSKSKCALNGRSLKPKAWTNWYQLVVSHNSLTGSWWCTQFDYGWNHPYPSSGDWRRAEQVEWWWGYVTCKWAN
jgi:hypothetical protein